MAIQRDDWGDGKHSSFSEEPAKHVAPGKSLDLAGDWGDGRTQFPIETTGSRDILREMQAYPNVPAAGDGAIDPALKARWGDNADRYFAIASAAVTDMCSRVSDPETFIDKFESGLPEHIQIELIDRLRIPPAKGRGNAAIIAFEDSLSDQDLDTFVDWFNDLDDDEKMAIKSYFNGG